MVARPVFTRYVPTALPDGVNRSPATLSPDDRGHTCADQRTTQLKRRNPRAR